MALAEVRPLETFRSLRDAVVLRAAGSDLATLCRHLARTAPWTRLRHTEQRRWELLGRTAGFDAWLIGWPPESGVHLHDHGSSSGGFLVLSGELVEITPTVGREGVVEVSARRVAAGQALEFGPHHVHDVLNPRGGVGAVSLHVYSPPLQSMTYFDVEEGGLVARETESLFAGEATSAGAGEPWREAR